MTQLIAEAQTNGAAYITPGTLENAAQQVEKAANDLQNNGWRPSTGGKNQ